MPSCELGAISETISFAAGRSLSFEMMRHAREANVSTYTDSENRNKLANLLDDYLKFRASKEGVAYDLDPQFFLNATGKGVWNFFGITADPKTGTLTEDFQNPTAFEEWSKAIDTAPLASA